MGRSPCCERAHTNKGTWTKEEDQRLISYIRIHGEGCWRFLPKAAGLLRCGKSCRLRWINYLRPDLKRGNFTNEENELIIKLHGALGNKWSAIAARLPGRTDNEIKNHWNTNIKRKLVGRGLDPRTHRPPVHGGSQSSGVILRYRRRLVCHRLISPFLLLNPAHSPNPCRLFLRLPPPHLPVSKNKALPKPSTMKNTPSLEFCLLQEETTGPSQRSRIGSPEAYAPPPYRLKIKGPMGVTLFLILSNPNSMPHFCRKELFGNSPLIVLSGFGSGDQHLKAHKNHVSRHLLSHSHKYDNY
ncbi:hypothetical protein OPV22_007670 [Ensete ventricosum]|uniref:Uncharacterized protein n=1 Tax=Ensete ventricosum TaxID=4639 RepID=A0AAV8RQQ0_ENSVE|nr:hypothetical protein OPV22_007670 [Ensete ventricosum]